MLVNNKYDPLHIILEHKRKNGTTIQKLKNGSGRGPHTSEKKPVSLPNYSKTQTYLSRLPRTTQFVSTSPWNIRPNICMIKAECTSLPAPTARWRTPYRQVDHSILDCKNTWEILNTKNRRSKFAQHLMEKGHAIGKMEEKFKIIYVTRKGRILNTIRKLPHIQGDQVRKPN